MNILLWLSYEKEHEEKEGRLGTKGKWNCYRDPANDRNEHEVTKILVEAMRLVITTSLSNWGHTINYKIHSLFLDP